MSVRRQCELLGLPRSSYYLPVGVETAENLRLMRRIDEIYLRYPFFGSRQMRDYLCLNLSLQINRKRVQRLMRIMGIASVSPGPRTTRRNVSHRIFPYLLRDLKISRKDQVWSTDITYIPLRTGFMYLAAVIDWWSRYVLSWRLSNSLDGGFCIEALEAALVLGQPEIFNTDQGSQFTSPSFTDRLLSREIAVSMDGRGRALDNVFIERLWRSVKYEDVYLRDYDSPRELERGLASYFSFYDYERPHSSLGGMTPAAKYGGKI
ncbi:Integrase core domain protein [Lignipirellula cremea]|uniref:Integrase core domain protein n=1 Tax=Lignipirellula cremea TaxID=2528010 RepID=A0A518DUR7_9BACT|nr:Integrase core domain protein [Lignipirellula cremea]QDU98626.1 Integrase core domain protein [Lignipirellula cremea]